MVIDWWEVTQTIGLVLGSILWYYLRTGGTVTVSLEFNKSQNGIVNYVIHNGGSAKIEDIRIEFERAPQDEHELWLPNKDATENRTLVFRQLLPDERHVSMFWVPYNKRVPEPIGVDVSYVHGRMFPRGPSWLHLPTFCRTRRRVTAVLDASEFRSFVFDVGYPGKEELEDIAKSLKELCDLFKSGSRPSGKSTEPKETS